MTTRKTKAALHLNRAMTKPKPTITTAAANRYGLTSKVTFDASADLFCRAAEHALVSSPLTVGSEIMITVELPVSLAVEIGISAHLLVRVQRAAFQVVFSAAARNCIRHELCQDITVEWDGMDATLHAIGPAYALERPHLAALELVWHKLNEMTATETTWDTGR